MSVLAESQCYQMWHSRATLAFLWFLWLLWWLFGILWYLVALGGTSATLMWYLLLFSIEFISICKIIEIGPSITVQIGN